MTGISVSKFIFLSELPTNVICCAHSPSISVGRHVTWAMTRVASREYGNDEATEGGEQTSWGSGGAVSPPAGYGAEQKMCE